MESDELDRSEEDACKKFEWACTRIGEHFKDYVLLARGPNGGMMWRSSDESWGTGAAKRYALMMDERDRCVVRDDFTE